MTYSDRYTEQAARAALPLVGPQGAAPHGPTGNEFADAAVARKVAALVEAIRVDADRAGSTLTAALPSCPAAWDVVAARAGVRSPSAATVASVVRAVAVIDNDRATHPDPFEGL